MFSKSKIKLVLITLVSALGLSLSSSADAADRAWAEKVVQSEDGGFYVLGYYQIDSADRYTFLARAARTGLFQWAKRVGDGEADIELSTNGGVYLVSQRGDDAYAAWISSDSSTLWETALGKGDPVAIKNRNADQIAAFVSGPRVLVANLLRKPRGTKVWARPAGLGDINGVIKISTGWALFGSTQNLGPLPLTEIHLRGLNENGRIIHRLVLKENKPTHDTPLSVFETKDNQGIVISQRDVELVPNSKYARGSKIRKLNSQGQTQWQRDFGGRVDSKLTLFTGGMELKDKGYLFVGFQKLAVGAQKEVIRVLRTDVNGKTVWNKTYRQGEAYSVTQIKNGRYVVAGTARESAQTQDFTPFFQVLDESGRNLAPIKWNRERLWNQIK